MSLRITDRETGEIREIDEPVEYWMLLREQAERDIQAWHNARYDALAWRHNLAETRANLEAIEAGIRLNGQIDGSNAETRKAQFDYLAHSDEAWTQTSSSIRDMEEEIGQSEADADMAHSRYRLVLRDLELMAALYASQNRERE